MKAICLWEVSSAGVPCILGGCTTGSVVGVQDVLDEGLGTGRSQMINARVRAFISVMIGCAILFSSQIAAQAPSEQVRFAAPKRIQAGDAFLGEGRLYPSPALHDVDGDKRLDIVVGDLIGKVTVAHRTSDMQAVAFGPEKKLNGADGKPLKFHNW